MFILQPSSCTQDRWVQSGRGRRRRRRGRVHDYNKEMYVICFWMYLSDWSALFYLVEVVQQALGHPTLPGLHSLGVCAGVQRHTAHGGTHLEALQSSLLGSRVSDCCTSFLSIWTSFVKTVSLSSAVDQELHHRIPWSPKNAAQTR